MDQNTEANAELERPFSTYEMINKQKYSYEEVNGK